MLYAQTTDPTLLEAAKDWSNDAGWREFYDRYAPAIRRHACMSGLSEAEAEDVVQETMMKVSRYLPRFEYSRTVCRFRSWLNQIVNQRIFDAIHQRKRGLFSESSMDDLRQIVHAVQATSVDPLAQGEVERRLLEACLARVRAKAKPRHWQLFEAHALHGLSAKETARLHHASVANVYIIRYRLIRALRSEWQRLLEKPFTQESGK